MRVTQVWSSVRQLRSHMLGSAAQQSEKKKKRQERDVEAWTQHCRKWAALNSEIVWRYSWWDLLIGLMWQWKGRRKSQDDLSSLAWEPRRRCPLPVMSTSSLLTFPAFCLSVSLSSEAFFDHVQQSSRLLTHVQFSLLRRQRLFLHPISPGVIMWLIWAMKWEQIGDFTIFWWNPSTSTASSFLISAKAMLVSLGTCSVFLIIKCSVRVEKEYYNVYMYHSHFVCKHLRD